MADQNPFAGFAHGAASACSSSGIARFAATHQSTDAWDGISWGRAPSTEQQTASDNEPVRSVAWSHVGASGPREAGERLGELNLALRHGVPLTATGNHPDLMAAPHAAAGAAGGPRPYPLTSGAAAKPAAAWDAASGFNLGFRPPPGADSSGCSRGAADAPSAPQAREQEPARRDVAEIAAAAVNVAMAGCYRTDPRPRPGLDGGMNGHGRAAAGGAGPLGVSRGVSSGSSMSSGSSGGVGGGYCGGGGNGVGGNGG
eukprot:4111619-Prymnesium_polylepis.1